MIALVTLDGTDAKAFASLTYPSLASKLAHVAAPWFAVGALCNNEPVALALGWQQPTERAQLVSIMVAPEFRRRGLGTRLLAAWQESAAAVGASAVCGYHSSQTLRRTAFEGLLVRAGGPAPRLHRLRFVGAAGATADEIKKMTGVRRRLIEPQTYSFDLWTSPTSTDRVAIERLKEAAGLRPDISVTEYEAAMDPACSLVVRRCGTLVGWVFAERLSRAPIEGYEGRIALAYPLAYLRKDLQNNAILIGAVWHPSSRQAPTYGRTSLIVFSASTPQVMRATRRRLGPIAICLDEVFESVKEMNIRANKGLSRAATQTF
jgi:GNAT superfamily N-acetyltransferase